MAGIQDPAREPAEEGVTGSVDYLVPRPVPGNPAGTGSPETTGIFP